MSLGPSAYELVEYREKMNGGSDTFDEVVLNLHFFYFWNNGDEQLLNYIISQSNLVFESALYLRETEHQVVTNCRSILIFNQAKSYKTFANKSNLIDYLFNFATTLDKQSHITQDSYFDIINNITGLSTYLFDKFKTKEYIQILVNNLDIGESYVFLTLLLVNGKEISFLKSIKFLDMIVEKIVENSTASNNAQSIIIKSFDSSLYSNIITSLMRENRLAQIIDNAVKLPDAETIEFLRYLAQEASYHFGISQWKTVIHLIDLRLAEFIDILTNQEIFTQISESVCSLAIAVLNYRKIASESMNSIFYKLSSDFFKFKCNTFLHNSFLKLIESYKSNKLLTNEILTKSQLFENIMQAFDSFDKLTCVYWGQLYQISKLINPYFKSNDQKMINDWTNVMKIVNQANKIVNTSYGGRLPFFMGLQRFSYDNIIAFGVGIFFIVALIYILVYGTN
ncbi:hypothetical protein TVAG_446250 [Trichomonas vaginalis G3]|uniref:Uncharacterized protein n=1 Tax=Trichomonas vaginalis (strain ATCC PRA-98 / G3) TaxID=412133 RepID=A2FG48_TRIV3|nr:hypothetical protein TVAGG3_0004140 [Trichomonas vaginalis G3]EAX96125.1 hypothetical protein TVAG_446250 [Trichomonas vaginalis G3]KAI5538800.1 hypothetical protein TVAGG3_0004140 [Trichomonas vaginalis G3]|eukprot:XP_001309055.1 hypothetical protein [Trichomonas vaginalis G3]